MKSQAQDARTPPPQKKGLVYLLLLLKVVSIGVVSFLFVFGKVFSTKVSYSSPAIWTSEALKSQVGSSSPVDIRRFLVLGSGTVDGGLVFRVHTCIILSSIRTLKKKSPIPTPADSQNYLKDISPPAYTFISFC